MTDPISAGPDGEVTTGGVGEVELIRRLAGCLASPPGGTVGIGDDTAVVPGPPGEDWLLTSDALQEGTHFLADADPEAIGHKAVARNLSDIAAMGGQPGYGLINLVAPRDMPVARLERVYDGAAATARRHGLVFVGGDTTHGDRLALHVFLTGHLPAGTACLRSGARPGDRLMVTGALGGSRTGRHLRFEPRVREGAWLRDGAWVSSMMDVSDGLATDIRHVLTASRVGARLAADRIPISAAARDLKGPESPLQHALTDGEDFELLFTVPPAKAESLAGAWDRAFSIPCTDIGEILEASEGLCLRTAAGRDDRLAGVGYDHFRV